MHYFHPGAIAIIVYCTTLLVTLTATKLDDRIGLHMANTTWLGQQATTVHISTILHEQCAASRGLLHL